VTCSPPPFQQLHEERQLDVLYSHANENEAYDPELVKWRKRTAHTLKTTSMMLAMRDVSELAGQLEAASMEELAVLPPHA
jgi:chemotaxis protein histidine kinase CheA